MANIKITDMNAASTPLVGTELLELAQSGASVKVAASDVAAAFATDAANVLLVANGGTGGVTLTGHLSGNGTSAVTASATIPFADLAGRAYASFYSAADQTGNVSTPTAIIFASTGVTGAGVTVVTDGSNLTRVTLAAAGTYRLSLNAQALNADASDHDILIWLRRNGTDVTNSTNLTNVPKTGDGGKQLFGAAYLVEVTAGQYVQVMWLPENSNVTLDATAAVVGPPAYPATSSATLQVERVA